MPGETMLAVVDGDAGELAAWLADEGELRGCVRRVAAPVPIGVLGADVAQLAVSRRFYSPSLLAEADAADQHIRRSRLRPGPPPSAICPCAPGLGHGRGRKTHGRGPWERLRCPSARLLASDLAFQDACSLSPSPSSRARDRTECPGCRGRRFICLFARAEQHLLGCLPADVQAAFRPCSPGWRPA